MAFCLLRRAAQAEEIFSNPAAIGRWHLSIRSVGSRAHDQVPHPVVLPTAGKGRKLLAIAIEHHHRTTCGYGVYNGGTSTGERAHIDLGTWGGSRDLASTVGVEIGSTNSLEGEEDS